MSARRAVAIGGGHGLSRTLRALAPLVDEVTAVVTVADDGGSSGRLRRDLGVLPPGDLRMAIAALASRDELAALLQYRFPRGELQGHSLGNLVLVAMQDLAGGDLVTALDRLATLLEVDGRVLPCTTTPVVLHACTGVGHVAGQAALAGTRRIDHVWLEPTDAPACADAVAAIDGADLIVLGPGSLFTSLLPNLLVDGVARAVAGSAAPVVLVTNLREQPGETEGLTLRDHLEVLTAHVPTLRFDAVVAHRGSSPSNVGAPLAVDVDELGRFSDRVVVADLLDGSDGHDPQRLTEVLRPLVEP